MSDRSQEPALAAVVQLFERRRDDAAHALAEVVARHQQALRQLEQLQGYCNEVAERWALREGEVLSLGVTRELHGFLGRLDQVQGIQRETIGRIEWQLQAAQRAVAQCKQRLRMVELLLERRQSARRSMADRAEQREMDAVAARQMAARKGLAAMAWR